MKHIFILFHTVLLTCLFFGVQSKSYAQELPPLKLDIETITVSGLSSGGYMATQFHFAHANWVSGAAVLAAGPYFCGQNSITTALDRCVDKNNSEIPLSEISKQVKQWQEEGKIDPSSAMKGDKVWLFHGTQDQRINAVVSNKLAEQYALYVEKAGIIYDNSRTAAHLFPTQSTGGDCVISQSPFIGDCDFDAAGALLSHLYGSLADKADSTKGKVIAFNQREWGGENAQTLAETGYVYIPESCASGADCQMHVSFHGCNQNAQAVGLDYVEGTGINNWADTNNLVVLYPQTQKSLFMPLNPQACWDWWGYTGSEYATKNGPQIIAVRNMIRRLANQQESQ